jgi:GTPase SAR1 family protein
MNGIARKVMVVNLDPANNSFPYECGVDINQLIRLEEVMETKGLGPNGGLIYCMEFLEKNFDWLEGQLAAHQDCYFLFDCPGQVELYTHHKSMQRIVDRLQSKDYRIAAIQLVDSAICNEASTYVSALLLSLSTMLQLGLPHVNVLSKIDLLGKFGKLDLNLDFYTEVQDLKYLEQYLSRDSFSSQFQRLNRALCELVEDFSLVAFQTLNIEDKESVLSLLRVIDKCNGYVYGGLTPGNESIMTVAERDLAWDV